MWSSSARRAWSLLALLGSWSVLACTTTPGSQRIVGPDGTAMAHVHCGADQGACFRIAGELCPSGYELAPVLAGRDGNFLVRCRVAAPRVTVTALCSSPTTPTAASRPREAWPPSNEPWPSSYPWPPPETNAVTQSPPPPGSTTPKTEIDLGY